MVSTRRWASSSPYLWRRITVPDGCPALAGVQNILATPNSALFGRPLVVRYLVDARTGETVRTEPAFCPPPVVASPPSPAQLGQAIRKDRDFDGALGVDPQGDGLTGLETRLWAQIPGTPVSVTTGLGGVAGETRAKATGFRWDMGDGTTYASTVPGTPDSPAASHTYQAKGDYEMVLTVTWRGTFTASRSGVASGPVDLGEVEVRYVRSYHVVEARAVRQ